MHSQNLKVMPDFPIRYRIRGEDVHLLEVMLPPGGKIRAESGAMVYMDSVIEMQTPIPLTWYERTVKKQVGETIFNPVFSNSSDEYAGIVAFSPPHPGQLIALNLPEHGEEVICQKGAYLCGTLDVKIGIAFVTDVKAALFGKEGFIMQKLSGTGLAFIYGGGTIIERSLQEGESIRVDLASLAAFDGSVTYTMEMVSGVINKFFGGEGMWLVRLTGPGRVYIQSTPFNIFAQEIQAQST